ncbi:MAG TPA: ABC transporter permease [Gaiellales bacterium]|jgi:peptide/nickel transport system permease protein|nr:ABC transporter permease [Gaiellales bacterium]
MSVISDVAVTPEPESITSTRRSGSVLRDALKLWRTRIGLVLMIVLVGIAAFGPYVAPHSQTAFVGPPFSSPSSSARLGTDYIGQDVLSRFLEGGRGILAMAALATTIGIVFGALVGLLAAYSRNWLDDVLMRGMDVILAFPQIMLALVAIATVGPKAWLIVLAVGLTTLPRVARVVRGAAQPIVERDFVGAAEALGVPRIRILGRELLPNVMSPLMVEVSLRLTYSIGLIAGLAFLGFATSTNGANWGTMINQNRIAVQSQPWGVVLPVLAIALLTIGTGLVGDGISRAAAGIERGRPSE